MTRPANPSKSASGNGASIDPARSFAARGGKSLPVWMATPETLDSVLGSLKPAQAGWLRATGWKPDAGTVVLVPGEGGALAGALLGLGGDAAGAPSPLLAGALPGALPQGDYHFATPPADPTLTAIGWALGSYEFTRYRRGAAKKPRRLVLPAGADRTHVEQVVGAVCFGRDLINTPANDLGPAELEAAALKLARAHGAKTSVIRGDDLLRHNLPLIHAVGRASDRAPRLIDFSWGPAKGRRVTLVGKGICFDTGGLNLKPGSSMALMKKDMGGAATVLSLARMVMEAKLPIRLRVLVPAAENNVSANAFRPGDVLPSRNGMTVEIGNTDAEGRLVLADALAVADEDAPELMVTIATLTGAARVALGPDLPPLYCTDDTFTGKLLEAGMRVDDPLWRMPFWAPYDKSLKSKIADVNHISDGPFAGSVTAALFLKRFVTRAAAYAHLDIYGWVPKPKPARPEGGEPQGARALFEVFRRDFAK
ncbi:MAG: leucyl aminopeptidase family protein [Pseudomonadota bacterium]|nr:leucyl aminopeptidase family protein [Pseudomonadota bacterium]